MSRAVTFTQAQVRRAVKAAESAGLPAVYIVKIGKHIKIGFSTNVERRMKSFETSSVDIELLLVVLGDRQLEKRLHELLSEIRIKNELFHQDWRITSFIRHVENDGLEQGLHFLEGTTPKRREEGKREDREARVRAARISKAEKDTYFASLVLERKQRLGW